MYYSNKIHCLLHKFHSVQRGIKIPAHMDPGFPAKLPMGKQTYK